MLLSDVKLQASSECVLAPEQMGRGRREKDGAEIIDFQASVL